MNTHKEYIVYRNLLLFTALVYPLFGYFNTFVLSPAIENEFIFTTRIAYSLLIVSICVVATFSLYLRERFYVVILTCMYIGLTHLIVIGYYNRFDFNHSLGVIMTIVGTSLIINSKKELMFYLCYLAVISSIAISLCPQSNISKIITETIFITIYVVTYIFMSFRIESNEKLKAANQKLEDLNEISSKQNAELILLASLMEHTHDAIQAADEEGNFIFMNKIGRDRLGVSENDVKNLTVFNIESVFKTKEDWSKHINETKERNGIIVESMNTDTRTGKQFPVEVRITNANINGKGYQIAVSKDISQSKKEEELKIFLVEISKNHLNTNDLRASFEKILAGLLRLTESEYGFIGEVFERDNKPYLKTHALTNISWNKETRDFYDKHAPNGMEFTNLETLFGYCLKHKEVVISNDPSNDTKRGGLPKGHPPLNAFLGLPILNSDNQIIGMVGIANKKGGYSEIDVQFLRPFSSAYSSIIQSLGTERNRKRIENKLAVNEAQLSSIFTSMTEGIVLQDANGMIVKCNGSAEKILGLSYDQMIGKKSVDPDWRAVHEDGSDFPGETHPAMESLRTGKPLNKVIMGVHKPNNELTWISINAMPLFENKSDKPTAVVCTFQDITTNKLQEQQIKDNLERLTTAQRIAKIGSWEFNPLNNELFWSDEHYSIFELENTASQDLYNAYRNRIHPEDIPALDQYVNDSISKGLGFQYKHRVILPNGRQKTVLGIGEVLKNAANETILIKGTVQDITDVEKLNEQNEMLSKLIEQSPDLIQVFDVQGNFIYANQAALDDLQITKKDITGKNINNYVAAYKENPGLWESGVQSLRENKQIYRERVITGKDGKETQVAATANLVKIANKEIVITFSRDITESKKQGEKVEQALKEKKIAENSAKMKEEFLANMSHEIRTPMNGVVGMIDLLEKTTSPTPIQIEYLQTIKNSSKTLLNIINDILDLSKLEAGKMQIRNEKVELMNVIENMVDLFRAKTLEKNISLLGSFGANIPHTIKTDSTRLKQIISNLISNAIKFTDNGSIIIKTEIIERNGNSAILKFSVSDTGSGIAKNDLELLFTSFKQLDSSSSKTHEGTGLGLAICKKIVGLMGGEINVESEVGKGSTFWFTIKTEIIEKQTSNFSSIETTTLESNEPIELNVLLVDDKHVNLIVAKTMLTSFGCTITTAKDGFEAIEKYDNGNFDIVFMDIQMPKMDGIEAINIIKAKHEKTCPIIALTANAMEGDKEKYLEEGFSDYLAKPIEMNTLRTLLQKWNKK